MNVKCRWTIILIKMHLPN